MEDQQKPKVTVGRLRGVYQRVRRPDRTYMDALKLRVPYWFVVLWLLGFASFQIWMNPFGFSDLVQRYTQDISDLLITGHISIRTPDMKRSPRRSSTRRRCTPQICHGRGLTACTLACSILYWSINRRPWWSISCSSTIAPTTRCPI
ncbi:MAG: hypothetical protein WDM89_03565 [Rhizomicrobium sp.]